MLNNLTLGKKITYGIGFLQIIALVLGLTAYYRMSTSAELAEKITTEYLKESELSAELSTIALSMKMDAFEFAYTSSANSVANFEKHMVQSQALIVQIQSLADQYPEELAFLNEEMTKIKEEKSHLERDMKLLVSLKKERTLSEFTIDTQVKKFIASINDMVEGLKVKNAQNSKVIMSELLLLSENFLSMELLVFQAKVNRKVSYLDKANGRLDQASEEVFKLKKLTQDPDILKQLGLFESEINLLRGHLTKLKSIEGQIQGELDLLMENASLMYQNSKKTSKTGSDKVRELANLQSEGLSSSTTLVIFLNVFCLLVGVSIGLTLIRSITGPVDHLKHNILKISDGDLSEKVRLKSKDELGIIAQSINTLRKNFREVLGKMGDSAADLDRTSSKLSDSSNQIQISAEQMSQHSENIRQDAEALHENIKSLTHSSQNINTSNEVINRSLSKVSNHIEEITSICEKEVNITSRATQLSEKNSANITELSQAIVDVSTVMGLIRDIAEKTDLLALNATIEAASAGEAGKGFAVVANEVKALSTQTSEATDQISSSVESIQTRLSRSVESNQEISKTILEIKSLATEILSALEHQSHLTADMESATLQATRDIQTIDESILTSEKAFAEIREKISSVSESAGSTLKETNVGKNQSQTLSEMAASLNELLKNFRI